MTCNLISLSISAIGKGYQARKKHYSSMCPICDREKLLCYGFKITLKDVFILADQGCQNERFVDFRYLFFKSFFEVK